MVTHLHTFTQELNKQLKVTCMQLSEADISGFYNLFISADWPDKESLYKKLKLVTDVLYQYADKSTIFSLTSIYVYNSPEELKAVLKNREGYYMNAFSNLLVAEGAENYKTIQ